MMHALEKTHHVTWRSFAVAPYVHCMWLSTLTLFLLYHLLFSDHELFAHHELQEPCTSGNLLYVYIIIKVLHPYMVVLFWGGVGGGGSKNPLLGETPKGKILIIRCKKRFSLSLYNGTLCPVGHFLHSVVIRLVVSEVICSIILRLYKL